MARPKKYPDELVQRGVRLALESGRPIAEVARDRIAFYGSNAVCAVWKHNLATGGSHESGLGNTYNIFPV